MGNLVLVRHGETQWSASGRHTSRTDIDLTEYGVEQARSLAERLARYSFGAVVCSPRLRARRTAELAGLVPTVNDDLTEWDYGSYEGLTSAEILERDPEWSLWTEGGPDGESPTHVTARADRVIAEYADAEDDVLLVAHGHILRVIGARWVGFGASGGAILGLDAAGISELGYEHDRRVIRRWNLS